MSDIAPWFQIAGVLLAIVTAIILVWWRLQNQITTNQAAHDKALAAYKLHVAETFVSKAGHRETMDQVMDAISAVKLAIDGTNLRIDRMWEAGAKPQSSRSAPR